jgi:hypothetical protein
MVPFRVPKKLFSNNALSIATDRVTRRLEDLYLRDKLALQGFFYLWMCNCLMAFQRHRKLVVAGGI